MNEQTSFGVQGMTCANCVARVERTLARLPGVQEASVNLATERARVTFDPAAVTPDDLHRAVEGSGYGVVPPVPPESTEEQLIRIEGMTCANCVVRVERALRAVPGVQEAGVNLATESATVRGGARPEDLLAAVQGAGYGARVADRAAPAAAAPARDAEETRLLADLQVAAIFATPLFLIAMVPMLYMPWHHALIAWTGEPALNWLMLLLATPVQLWAGRRFYRQGWAAFKHRSPDMNSLVMLGTTAAYLYSVVVTVAPGLIPAGSAHVYFEASAVVISLVLLGKYLEARAKRASGDAMRALLRLQPDVARVERDGLLVEVPTAQVAVGDVLHLRPGERVPVDGEVLRGETHLDESMLTGEPLPVHKAAGDPLTGGTVNGSGALTFRATAVGAQTTLSRIVRMVEDAQGSKPPIQRAVDAVVARFVPVVLLIAAVTMVAWLMSGRPDALAMALVHTVAVLIIACPCAMGLAAPVSIMVSGGKAASLGLIFRSGAAVELLGRGDLMALDKTGTLTSGQPQVVAVQALDGDGDRLLALAAAAEAHSEHPLARAIEDRAATLGLKLPAVEDVQATPGGGITAQVGGQPLHIGSARFLGENGVDTAALDGELHTQAAKGRTPVLLAVGGELRGLIALADTLRPESKAALAALRKLGVTPAMVTGDLRTTAQAVAGELGIAEVKAEVRPEGKAEAVQAWQADGRRVVFVGDGINDAPALAQANVGVAIGSGTDVAVQTADVVLMRSDLRAIVSAVELSRATMRNIRMNLFWAFFYNASLIPVAAGVFSAYGLSLSPMFAAAAMGLSSVFVMSNALRLRGFQPRGGNGGDGEGDRPSPRTQPALR